MDIAKFLFITGLILDLLGILIISIPLFYSTRKHELLYAQYHIRRPEGKKAQKEVRGYYQIGISLIFFGFLFQLIGYLIR